MTYGTAFDRAQSAYDRAEPDEPDFDIEECPLCFVTYRYNSDGEPYLHPECEAKIERLTCCGFVWCDGGPCERRGRVLEETR